MDDYKALIEELHLLREPFSYSSTLGVRAENALESQRSRIAALEAERDGALLLVAEAAAVIDSAAKYVRRVPFPKTDKLAELLSAAPSTVLDQMIREAKAEALTEAAARARALFDMRTTLGKPSDEWLADRAAEYRNGDA